MFVECFSLWAKLQFVLKRVGWDDSYMILFIIRINEPPNSKKKWSKKVKRFSDIWTRNYKHPLPRRIAVVNNCLEIEMKSLAWILLNNFNDK